MVWSSPVRTLSQLIWESSRGILEAGAQAGSRTSIKSLSLLLSLTHLIAFLFVLVYFILQLNCVFILVFNSVLIGKVCLNHILGFSKHYYSHFMFSGYKMFLISFSSTKSKKSLELKKKLNVCCYLEQGFHRDHNAIISV